MSQNQYSYLFKSGSLGNKTMPNRFVSQAMEANDGGPGGSVSEMGIERYKKLASGHWGAVVVEALSADSGSLARVNQMILTRENLEGFKFLVSEFKRIAPETILLFQVTHSGRKAVKSHSTATALYSPAEGEKLLSTSEGIEGGCGTSGPGEILEDLEEMEKIIKIMENLGMDYVNISAGIPGTTSDITRPTAPSKNLYLHQMRYTKWAKGLTKMKVIGSAYSILKEEALSMADENIRKGYADCAGWGRQSFADPLFPEKVRLGEPVDYCTACSGCTKLMVAQKNDGCILYNDYYKNVWKNRNK
jgi:2,4-dienoyl-CoA reductase-like NADH-dependent reductase (Old Yellow Enzyme family)